MAKQDLGKKRRCASCGMKFYDFNKSKIECPSCQTVFNPDQLLKSRRGRAAKAEQTPAASAEVIQDSELLADDEADEDADALGEDEALVNIAPTESNDEEDGAAILDDSVDEDFIDEIEDDAETQEGDEEL